MGIADGRWVGRLVVAFALTLGACDRGAAPTAERAEPMASAAQVERDKSPGDNLPSSPGAKDEKSDGWSFESGGAGKRGIAPGGGGLGAESPARAYAPPGPAPTMGGYGDTGKGTGGRMMQRPSEPPAVPTEAPLDPNGRFATTYRPGGGHLAAFESAVARGIIPETERDLVGDIGARYWSPMDEPQNKALAIRTEFERAALQPGGGPVHMRVSLRSTTKNPSGRPHLSVHLVLDVSGSMSGEPIRQARAAAHSLADKLAATDDFSLVAFSSDSEVKVKDGPAGPRKAAIHKAIDEIHEGGGTNIGAGLQMAYAEAQTRTIPRDAVRVVFLLSDGRANSGITDRSRLSRLALDAFQQGVQTSTFGLGSDYDGALMSAIASDGAGGYYYLRDSEQIAPALATELDKRLDPVATAVEVRIRLKPEVNLLRAYGSRRLNQEEASRVRAIEEAADRHAETNDGIKRDRQDDPQGGMRFFIPAFARDDNHAMLLKLEIPKGVGKRAIAEIELKYKDRVSKRNVTEEMRVTLDYANSDAESANSVQPAVARTVQGFAAGEALLDAANQIARGDAQSAVALLTEREQILRRAAEVLQEPAFLRDADRLARLRTHVGSGGPISQPLVLAMLLETAGRSHLH